MSYAHHTVLLLVASVLAACGGGGGGGSTSSAASPAPTTPAASSADAVTPPADAASAVTVACMPGDGPETRSAAFTLVNLTRLALGLSQPPRLAALDTTAQAHAQYVVANGSTAMEEVTGRPCFTGADLTQRLAGVGIGAAEAPGRRGRSEVILAFEATGGAELRPWDYVNDLVNSLYGRVVLLDPHMQQLGIGFSAEPGGTRRALVLDTALLPGAPATGSDSWVIWPRDGATGLPTRMRATNIKPLEGTVTEGYPITVHAAAALQVFRFTLSTATDGLFVDATVMTAANDRNGFLAGGEAALLPRAPLAAGTTYRVELDGSVGTTAVHQVWSFTTAS